MKSSVSGSGRRRVYYPGELELKSIKENYKENAQEGEVEPRFWLSKNDCGNGRKAEAGPEIVQKPKQQAMEIAGSQQAR